MIPRLRPGRHFTRVRDWFCEFMKKLATGIVAKTDAKRLLGLVLISLSKLVVVRVNKPFRFFLKPSLLKRPAGSTMFFYAYCHAPSLRYWPGFC